jgi:hypothetical protein
MKRYDVIHATPLSSLKDEVMSRNALRDPVASGQRQNIDILARPIPPPRILSSYVKRPKMKEVQEPEGVQDDLMDIESRGVQ